MKVLFDHQIFQNQVYGGVSRYHIELAKEINRFENHEVIIPATFVSNQYLKMYQGNRVWNVKNHFLMRCIHYINKKKNLRLIRNGKVDIVHPTWTDTYVVKHAKGKLVITVHDMIQEIFGLYGENERINKKNMIYNADRIIAISESTKRDILKLYQDIPEDKIRVIYHGTNHLPEQCRPLDWEVPEKYILFVGGRKDYKNGSFFIEATSRLMLDIDEINVICVGGGEYTVDEYEIMKKYGVQSRFHQRNVSDSELSYLYEHAVCFVYPSLYEGFGFPILEAFDNNCPVICCNSSSLPEVGGDAAFYFEKEDYDTLIRLMKKMCIDDAFRMKQIKKGQERVKEFTWEKTAKETIDVYKELLDYR